jgi:hypothetical protein
VFKFQQQSTAVILLFLAAVMYAQEQPTPDELVSKAILISSKIPAAQRMSDSTFPLEESESALTSRSENLHPRGLVGACLPENGLPGKEVPQFFF